MPDLREGQTGVAPDGTRVIVRNGRIVPVEAPVSAGGAAAAGFTDLGDGWYRAQDGGTFQRNRQGQLIRRTGTPSGNDGEARNAKKDFDGQQTVKDFRDIQSAYNTIVQAARDGTGASDIVLAMAFNKVMDPTSVVREGEFDRAASAGGVPDRLQSAVSRAINGELLTPRIRQEIVNASQSMYEVRRDQYNDETMRARELAEISGIAPDRVARREFRGQRITSNPTLQEMGQANAAQVAARPDDYDPRAALGSPQRPYVLSPGAGPERLPAGASYIDMDGKLVSPVAEAPTGPGADSASAVNYRDPANQAVLAGLISSGGWLRDGDGEPYYVGPGGIQARTPTEGEREVAPGIFERAADAVGGAIGGAADAFGAFAQSATEQIPFLDEAAAYAVGAVNGRPYSEMRDMQQEMAADDRRERPIARNLGGIAGAAAPVVAAVASGGVTAAPSVGRSALTGAGAGGLYGFAADDGSITDRVDGGVLGGALGGFGGAVVAPVVGALAPVATNAAQSVGRFGGRMIGRTMTALGVPGGAALQARATPSALTSGLQKFGNMTPIESSALVPQAQAFVDNGIQPAFVDIAGDGAQSIARAMGSRQTNARQGAVDFGARRRVNAQARVSEIARRNLSPDPRTATQVADELAEDQQRLSAEAMGPIRDERVRLTPETATVFRTPGGRSAIEQARAWAANSQQSEELAALARLADDAVDAPGQIDLSLGTVDRLRRSLTNQARAASDGDTRQGLTGLSRQVRGDAVRPEGGVPAYGQFLQDYADRAQLDDATTFGANFMARRGAPDFAREAAAMNPAQNTVARVAARDAVEDRGSTPAGAAGVLDDLAVGLGRGQRSDGLLGPEAADRLRANADFARRELETGRNVSPRVGSPTNDNTLASRLANGAAEGVMIARDIATGNKPNLAIRAVDFMRSRGFSDAEVEAVLPALIDENRTQDVIQYFISRGATARQARTTARTLRHLGTTQSGAGAGRISQ